MFRHITFRIILMTCLIFGITTMVAAQNYYPTNIGNIWVMESEDKTERLTYTLEASEESINGKELALLKITTETLGTDSIITEKFFVDFDEEGIKLHKFEVELGSAALGVAAGVLYPPILFYPLSLELGDSWKFTTDLEVNLVGPITFTSVNTVVVVEQVVTPAGTFENCLKIRLRTRTDAASISRSTVYQWLAPNFGPVKFENSQDIVYKLVSSNLLYDVTGDGVVNILDLVFVASRFGQEDTEGDVNNDGEVNILDLVLVAQNFGN